MRALAVVVGVVAGACVTSDLVPCGDLACPAGDLCLADTRCVAPNAFEACAGLAPGDACRLDDRTSGRCVDGACVVTSCGNAIVEPGEACDDGNQVTEVTGSVRCNATCTSDETCGNGIVDVGESCDCGATAVAAGCTEINGATSTATCHADCTPAHCGDGIVGPFELCDGAPPADLACIQFGYDLGTMTCSSACGPGFDACEALGWDRVHDVRARVAAIAGRDGRIGVIYEGGATYAIAGGIAARATQTYDRIAAAPNVLWALGATHVGSWKAATGWVEVPRPASIEVTSLWADDDAIYASLADGSLYRFDGMVATLLPAPGPPAAYRFARARDHLWALDPVAGAYQWLGDHWSSVRYADRFIAELDEDGLGRRWFAAGVPERLYVDDGVSVQNVSGPFLYQFATTDRGAIILLHFLESPTLHLVVTDPDAPYATDEYLPGGVLGTDGRVPLYGFDTGLYGISHGRWVPDGTILLPNIAKLAGGPIVHATPAEMLVERTGGYVAIPGAHTDCAVAGVTADGTAICSDGAQIFDGATTVPIANVDVLWSAADGAAIVGAGAGGSFAIRDATGWHPIASPAVRWQDLAGDAIDELYGVAYDATTNTRSLYRFDGTAFTQLADLPGYATGVAVLPDRVLVPRPSDLLVIDRATGAQSALAPPVSFAAVATGTGSDAWAIAAGFSPELSPLWRYDGTTWSPVRVPADYDRIGTIVRFGPQIVIGQPLGQIGYELGRLVLAR